MTIYICVYERGGQLIRIGGVYATFEEAYRETVQLVGTYENCMIVDREVRV